MPERSTFQYMGQHFNAFSGRTRANKITFKLHGKRVILFKSDKITYRAEVYIEQISAAGDMPSMFDMKFLNVKLPNDGYLYTLDKESSALRSDVQRHGGTFCLLQPHQYLTELSPMLEWFKVKVWEETGREIQHTDIQVQLLYSFENERMDLKFLSRRDQLGVNITFEPGWPEEDFSPNFWSPVA
jgi:hypothetical protein